MIGTGGKEVVGVIIFTVYADGTVDFFQDAPRKTPEGFAALYQGFKNAAALLGRSIKNQAKCPFSPDNPDVYSYEDNVKPYKGTP